MLFIHGILGAAFKTWRQKDRVTSEEKDEREGTDNYTECWPKVKKMTRVVIYNYSFKEIRVWEKKDTADLLLIVHP